MKEGLAPVAHHHLGVAQHVLVPGRVQDDATGVGVDTVDVQDTELPLLLCPLQHLHNTNSTHFTAKWDILGKFSKEAATSSSSLLHQPPQPVVLVRVNTSAVW